MSTKELAQALCSCIDTLEKIRKGEHEEGCEYSYCPTNECPSCKSPSLIAEETLDSIGDILNELNL